MYKDLSFKDKAKVIQQGVKLGLTSLDDIQSLYDEAIGHKFAQGSSTNPDYDPENPYHYHTANGEKVVITPEDWEKHKGQPYFKQIEDAVLAEQTAHPGPEYIINPQFSENLRHVYKGNMGPKYQNYSSFSGNLPQGYSFTPEGLVQDNQGNLYVQKGFRQTPRFTYDENNPLVFPVLEGRNQGNVTFYPVNMEKTEKKPDKIDKSIDFKSQKINYINSSFVSFLHPELATSDYLPEHKKAIKQAKKLGYRVLDNYSEGQFNGYLIGFTDKELSDFKTELWNYLKDNNHLYDLSGHPSSNGYLWNDGDYYNESDWFKPETLTPKGRITGGGRKDWNGSIYSDGPNGNQGFQTRYEMQPVLKPYIEVGPLQVNDVQTYAKGGLIETSYGNYIPDNNGYRNDPNVITGNKYLIQDFEGKGYVPLVGDMNKPIGYFSNAGEEGVLYPGEQKNVLGSKVYEHPLIDKFQSGGQLKPSFNDWYSTVPQQKNDTSSYDLRRAYNSLPFEELEKFRTIPEYHLPSVAYNEDTDTYTFLKRKGHPTLQYELDWYNSPEAEDFRNQYLLDTIGPYYRYIPRENEYKSGGGIHINPKNKGKFTATKKRTGKTTEELTHSRNPLTRKRAIFAQNMAKIRRKHEEGGFLEGAEYDLEPIEIQQLINLGYEIEYI